MKERKRVLVLDRYEYGVLVNALNNMRNSLIWENHSTDYVDDILLKVIDAPVNGRKI
jgi:hypothetical protein